jgi:cathepsin L
MIQFKCIFILLATFYLNSLFCFAYLDEYDEFSIYSTLTLQEQWQLFKERFNKTYHTQWEKQRRLIWESNKMFIDKHNEEYEKGFHTFTLGINQFADMTLSEFQSNHLLHSGDMFRHLQEKEEYSSLFLSPMNIGPLPESVDWRKEGFVTPVKNQGQCGSCWAFSATGALEGQYFRKSKQLESFSEQQLVDCSHSQGNMGCNGGLMDNAFKYVKTKGIEKETDYPYKGKDLRCNYNESKVVTRVSSFSTIAKGNETALQIASATVGPISVAIDASQSSFQFYKSGVYNEPRCSSASLDHGVLLVGYGADPQNNLFWLVKNSWGVKWGEAGYIRMSRNKKNQCGISTMASYPLI